MPQNDRHAQPCDLHLAQHFDKATKEAACAAVKALLTPLYRQGAPGLDKEAFKEAARLATRELCAGMVEQGLRPSDLAVSQAFAHEAVGRTLGRMGLARVLKG